MWSLSVGGQVMSGQRSTMSSRVEAWGAKTRVRHEMISTVQPMRFRVSISPSAGPSISMRWAFMIRRRARRQPLARGKAVPWRMISV